MKQGDNVPDFTALDQTGQKRSLYSMLESGPVVLFFYPKAMTSGCTVESCHFRDLASDFAAVGAQIVGISADSVERQATFDSKHSLGYPLLSDPDKAIARQFGVKRMGPIFNKRSTFVIGPDHTIVAEISSETNMDVHADQALAAVKGLNP